MSHVSSAPAESAKPVVDANRQRNKKWRIAGFFAFLFVVEWYVYFRHAGHYFQADTVFLLYHRAQSLPEFLREFTRLQLSGWYRPLSHQVFESILYPFLGLNPVGYRIPVYAIFIANTIAVYILVLRLLRQHTAAALATFFFAVHTTNGFATYDLAFMPDLLYALLYLCAVLSYIQFVEGGSRAAYALSIGCFIGSLLSKEAAVTLPAILFLTYFLITPAYGSLRVRLSGAVRSTSPYAGIVVVYLIFVVGYLHVQGVDLTTLFQKPETVSPESYQLAFDKTIAQNVDLAASWAFNMPRGWNGGFRDIPHRVVVFLSFFRAVALGLMAFLLFKPQRKVLLFGAAWFLLTALPALPLVNHFLPYYLFLPNVGLSLVIGASFAWAVERIGRLHWMAAASMVVLFFGGLLIACSASIHADVNNHRLLGGSADIASRSLDDLMRLYPVLPANAIVYIDDREEPLAWDHSWGGLINMAYKRDDITVLYSSVGDALGLSQDASTVAEAIVLKYREGKLIDETAEFRKAPFPQIPFTTSNSHSMTVSPSVARRGDSYFIAITGAHDSTVKIAYTIDGGPARVFSIHLDHQGHSRLDVSENTPKGSYRLFGFLIEGEKDWMRSDSAITVE
jgi:hypothetical protein